MDTSAEYIKMCDCPEIQEQEFDYRPNFYFAYYLNEQWKIEHDFLGGEKPPIWLPRQDQIQAMLRKHYAQKMGSKRPHDKWFPDGDIGLGFVFDKFKEFASGYMREVHKSFEKLWLACFMYEVSEKVWTGKEWK